MLDFARVLHFQNARRHRQAADLQRLVIVVGDRDGHARVAADVRELLAVAADEAVEDQPVIGVSDDGGLRPSVRPVRRNGHDAMRVEQAYDPTLELLSHVVPLFSRPGDC